MELHIRLVLVQIMAVAALALLRGQQMPDPSCFPSGKIRALKAPRGLPPLPKPPDNPPTAEAIALGRHLFFDPILSGNSTFSCTTCHKPPFGYADDEPLTVGAAGLAPSASTPRTPAPR